MEYANIVLLQIFPFTYLVAIFSLLVGSFLNVVIYRLPIILNRQWRDECQAYLGINSKENTYESDFTLWLPRSRCVACGNTIKFYENIPVISYLFLRGKCSNCRTSIPIRYPLIEIIASLLGFLTAWRFGLTLQTFSALMLGYYLICLAFIDLDYKLLPDILTLPLLWMGLLISVFDIFVNSQTAIIGAIVGYLFFWGVFQVFRLLTGKEGMGYGDFKLLSASGAWLGWQLLPLVVILASLLGITVGILLHFFKHQDIRSSFPFGPFLSIAIWISMLWGHEITSYFHLI